uniref:uncharacterized protein LOC120951945 n=1 Tax=Anopheles coluzzii TaxID=1518534 RepID=UPI0020FFEE2E|nr:uncharacterized protein LOC120951945 [Anopheles coluzzii]
MDAGANQDASCEVIEQHTEETPRNSPERRESASENIVWKDESALQPAVLPRDLEVRRKWLEIRKKQFELEKSRQELELELLGLELEEEKSDRNSRGSDYVEKTEVWLHDTKRVGKTTTVQRDGGERLGHSPSTPAGSKSATAGAMRVAAAPSREECAIASASRGQQPSTPTTNSTPPDYDRTLAIDQAAAMEREYAQWRRVV